MTVLEILRETAKKMAVSDFEAGARRFLEGTQESMPRPCYIIAEKDGIQQIFRHPCEAERLGWIESESDFENVEWEYEEVNSALRAELIGRGIQLI